MAPKTGPNKDHPVEITLRCEAKTIEEFMAALADSGFACAYRVDGRIVDGQGLKVRVVKLSPVLAALENK